MRLEGRAAIVTGAASGIGAATAELFAREGASVLAVDLFGTDLPTTAASTTGIDTLECDIAAEDSPDRIIGEATRRFGRLDILFNNAGTGANQLAEVTTLQAWDRVMAVNLRAMFLLSRQAIPSLKESGRGRIINTASVMAQRTDYGLAAYCASKAGVAGLTRTLALELGRYGITANYIEPGAILTGMTRQNFSDDNIRAVWERKAALKRLGQPIDIARAALFLASDDAAFITGHGLVVDGGLTLRV